MGKEQDIKHYSPAEERINIYSHAVGLIFSVIALVLLVVRAFSAGSALYVVSAAVFGLGLVALYAASTAYHSATDPARRKRLRVVDHAAIYLLIAGTYTPLVLITLGGAIGWTIFTASWAMAATGIGLKLFFTGRFDLLSTLMYIFMGWMIVFAMKPLIEALSSAGLFWLFFGGVCYTVGAVIYSIRQIPFNHAIFHLFVLAGSICHFIAVYWYVLPGGISETGG